MCDHCYGASSTPGFHDCDGTECEKEIPNVYIYCSEKCQLSRVDSIQKHVEKLAREARNVSQAKVLPLKT